ncbi:MAG: hypothetical protein NVSMB65_16510 [Chloroflexota bacterium]
MAVPTARAVSHSRLIFVSLLASVLVVGAWVAPASAHATLVTSTIKAGAVLAAVPRTLSATFAEGVDPKGSFLRVFEAAGDHAEVDLGNAAVSFKNAKQMVVGLPRKLPRGRYVIMWFAISADDGHKAGGVLSFTIK